MQQAKKVLGNTRPVMVVKDMSKALWGDEVLAERSYGGRVAPRDKRNNAVAPRPPLTPEKVALVIGTWNQQCFLLNIMVQS